MGPAECNSATSFATPRALITFPLGVLQSGSIRFTPELPSEKKSAQTRRGQSRPCHLVLPLALLGQCGAGALARQRPCGADILVRERRN
jgi:hypothetical protein